VPEAPVVDGVECVVEGDVPAARIHELQQQLPGATRGEALLESAFDRHEPVRGELPSRPRTDHDPLSRKDYLLALTGRAAGHRSR
jgi:ribosomal protection tetracycline resistance protein